MFIRRDTAGRLTREDKVVVVCDCIIRRRGSGHDLKLIVFIGVALCALARGRAGQAPQPIEFLFAYVDFGSAVSVHVQAHRELHCTVCGVGTGDNAVVG
ncbi:hypothetical protein D3C87_1107010 [compost metagenome]